jgi:phage terminase large subunit GpA-like protein
MLAVYPTDRIATTWSKDRLAPMLRDTPALRGRVTDRRTARIGSGSSEVLEKKFAGGLLAITGANSAAGLAMRPVRAVLGDEIDRFPGSAGGKGGDEGDPVELASKRSSNFPDSLHIWASSPGKKSTSRIWPKYLATNRCEWYVPCPECQGEQILTWEHVEFCLDDLTAAEKDALSNAERASRARYACEHCGVLWDDVQRIEASLAGRWVAEKPNVTARRGFHLAGLASPWLNLAEIVEEFLEAAGDPLLLQVWTNTRLAEVWDDAHERLEPEAMLERLEVYPSPVPAGVLAITAGVDVQKYSLEVTRYGWGIAGESWAIDHHVLQGDPATLLEAKEDTRLDDVLLRARFRREDGAPLRVAAAGIDTGGDFYEEVLAYCRKRRGRNVWAIKGRAGETVPLWPLRATKVKRKHLGRAELHVLGVDAAKTILHRALKRSLPEDYEPGTPLPGFLHFPVRPEFDAEFFSQLAAEVPVAKKVRGRVVIEWHQDYPRAEACDCFVYARAAIAGLAPNWEKLEKARKRDAKRAAEAEDETEETPIPRKKDDEPDEPQKPGPKTRRVDHRRRRRRRGGYATNY